MACNLCEAICGIELTIVDDVVQSVRGNPRDPLSRGHICPKGVSIADIHHDPDRLRRPVRKVAGRWEEISWEVALDHVAENLARLIEKHGRSSVGVYFGNPNSHSVGSQTHMVMLLRALRTQNVFSATSVDQLPHHYVSHLLYGHQMLLPVPDIDRTSCLLIFGGNPMASNGSLMTVPDFPGRRRELRQRGGRLIVFDPRRTETAKIADEYVPVRPGTDAFVLLAMLSTILDAGLATPAPYVRGVDQISAAVARFTPERAAEASGVPAAAIRRIALEYAESGAGAVYGRMGVSTQAFGTVCQWAIQCLNAITGNLDRPGGTMFTHPAIDLVEQGLVGPGHIGKWASRVRGLPEVNGELPAVTMLEEITTPGEGQIRALATLAGNPVLSTPGGRRLAEALPALDFMFSVDIYINETTRHADVILPPTSALERTNYDLILQSLAVRNTARLTRPAFTKPLDALDDWQIYGEIAGRLARRLGDDTVDALIDQLGRPPEAMVDELLRTGRYALSVAALDDRPDGVDLGELRPSLPGRLRTKDGAIALAQPAILAELEKLERAPRPSGDQLMLIGRRHQRDCNSWLHNVPRLVSGRPRHHLLMNPADMSSRNITDGDTVTIRSRMAEVRVEVAASDDMMPGVVSLPHGFGHAAAGSEQRVASTLSGASVNDLTDPEQVELTGNAALSGLPVTVTPWRG